MSLEQKIDELTTAVKALTAQIAGAKVKASTSDSADAGDDADDEKPAKKKRRTKAEIAAEEGAKVKKGGKKKDEDEDDGDDADDFDDADDDDDADDAGDDDGDEVTADNIRDLLMKVKDKKGANAARDILAELGVKTIAQIAEKQYPKAIALAKKVGVKL